MWSRLNLLLKQAILLLGVVVLSTAVYSQDIGELSVIRLPGNPVITPQTDPSTGTNIQGPSLIRVPSWVENPLGRYYLYFADHRGLFIRMAYADALEGPWQVYREGTLQLADTAFPTTCPPCSLAPGASGDLYAHIASPDVHVRQDLQQIVMYVHGRDEGTQLTRLALSRDGIHFTGEPRKLGRPYFRVVKINDYYYAMSMPGFMYRSRDGLRDFEPGPRFFDDNMRHSALLKRNNTLYVFFTRAGDAPERIYVSAIELNGDWLGWTASPPKELLRPELEWEGASLGISPSRRGYIDTPVNQLRDPAIFEEDGQVYLLYSVAGESGIAIARLQFNDR